LSYHSPKYGFICSNVISYKVVLADGSIVTASEDEHHDLWLALKGGANNFGVVASFTYKTFPTDKIWSGQYLGAGFLAKKSFTALHEYIKYAADPVTFDERASVPITSINYLGMGGTPLLYTQLTYSEPTKTGAWPQYWKKSPFSSLWRLPIGAGNKTVHDVVQSLGEFTPSGFRNTYGTTTLRNNLETILAAHQIAKDCTPLIKHVKGGAHVMIFQTILPQWINRGTPNVLGLEDCKEPLIIVNFSVSWSDPKDDELMSRTTRDTITKIEEVAAAHNANHPYRFTNYASEWQRPLEGYGQKNIEFMQKVSREYDPNGLFQTGCLGGFKLGMKPEKGTDSSLVAS
jgi:FAD/FMN-containing dehydrogenase